ncbi:MAG: DMT family transporter [Acidobacteriota bacterium]
MPDGHTWRNLRGQGASPQDVANSIPLSADFIAFAQLQEDGFSPSDSELTLQLAYERLRSTLGVTSPAQTGIVADYWDGLRGCSIDALFPKTVTEPNLATIYQRLREGMADQSAARKRWRWEQEWTTQDSDYFSGGFYQYRNWYVGGYLNGLKFTSAGRRAYELIYNLERRYLAIEDRTVQVFAWDSFEGIDTPVYSNGVWPLLTFENPPGSIARVGLVQVPHSIMKEEAFFTLLLVDAVMWMTAPVIESPFTLPAKPVTWIAILWLGFLGAGISYLMFYGLLQAIGPTRVSLITYVIPVVGVTLGVIFLNETLDWSLAVAALLIVVGVWAVNRK